MDSQSHTCDPANILASSARGAQRRNTRRETRDSRRSSFRHPPDVSCPITRQTITDPPNLPYPTRRCDGSASALLAAPPGHVARRRRGSRPGRRRHQ
eukprot:3923659-Prymnesium_polylepis.1